MLALEQEAWGRGFRRVAGVDEAGRGPWAGPVYAAAVLFQQEDVPDLQSGSLRGLTDSKRLSEPLREKFFERLTGDSRVEWAIASATADEIDRLNILQATLLAMARAVGLLPHPPDFLLVDGLQAPAAACPARCIVRGDARSLSIAAASVLAKVSRDRRMLELDAHYPGYGFARHKGYGTAAHRAALERLGPCPEHRRTFRPVAARLAALSGLQPAPISPSSPTSSKTGRPTTLV